MMTPYRNLAASVIQTAYRDLVAARKRLKKKLTRVERRHAQAEVTETLQFLTGQTEIAAYWFTLAELNFFDEAQLFRFMEANNA